MTGGARLPKHKGFEARRPPDVSDARWQTALRGLQRFVANGHGGRAEALGWSHDELYRVPKPWSQTSLTGVALLVGDNEVVEVTATEIGTKTATGAIQIFRRKPEPDFGLVYRERLKLFGLDASCEEVQLRTLEHTVRFCRNHRNCDFETAKAAVLAAIKRSLSSSRVPAR
jgi:hypothetical protein